jgi:hypothetical protein
MTGCEVVMILIILLATKSVENFQTKHPYLFFAVRGRCSGNVFDREPEALLHCDEEVGQKKAAKSDKETEKPVLGSVLRSLQL